MHKNKLRNNVVASVGVVAPRSIRRNAVTALASELRKQGHADLADAVTLGPVALAVEERTELEAEEIDLDDEIEDVLEDASDSEDEEDFDGEDDEEEFEEELDSNDIADEDEADGDDNECDADDDAEPVSNPISAVILDPDRKYSRAELATLRSVATRCLAKKNMIPNAKALLASLDEYESR
jgi:hypothetical protein